jgi:hypothetical protein
MKTRSSAYDGLLRQADLVPPRVSAPTAGRHRARERESRDQCRRDAALRPARAAVAARLPQALHGRAVSPEGSGAHYAGAVTSCRSALVDLRLPRANRQYAGDGGSRLDGPRLFGPTQSQEPAQRGGRAALRRGGGRAGSGACHRRSSSFASPPRRLFGLSRRARGTRWARRGRGLGRPRWEHASRTVRDSAALLDATSGRTSVIRTRRAAG